MGPAADAVILAGRGPRRVIARPVAHRLAAELLAGRVRSEVSGWPSRPLAGVGVAELIAAAVLCVVTGDVQPWLASPGLYGVFGLSLGHLRPRLIRRRLEQSLRLNA